MTEGKAEKDAEILFPERELTINDEKIIVNEINFTQGLGFGALINPMTKALAELFSDKEDPEFEDITEVFAAHKDVVLQLMAVATGKDIDWIEKLGDADGQALMTVFWVVNSDFFTRRVVAKGMTALLKNQQSLPVSESSSAH